MIFFLFEIKFSIIDKKVNHMKIIEKSLDEKKVKQISQYKKEPSWMTEFRLKSYQKFIETKNPNFGPPLSINFDLFTYYKKVTDDVKNNWNDVKKDIQETFCQIGLIESEKKYLDGVGDNLKVKLFTII